MLGNEFLEACNRLLRFYCVFGLLWLTLRWISRVVEYQLIALCTLTEIIFRHSQCCIIDKTAIRFNDTNNCVF